MSEKAQIEEGGGAGGVSEYTVCGRGKADHLTRSELRVLQRAARTAQITPEQSEKVVAMIDRALDVGMAGDDDRVRLGLSAVGAHIALLDCNRKEELHAIEVEERLRALEAETQPATGPGGITIVNQQVMAAHPMMDRMAALFAQDKPAKPENTTDS